jgi:hypothetical protein
VNEPLARQPNEPPTRRSRRGLEGAPLLLLVAIGALELLLFLWALAQGARAADLPILMVALVTILIGAAPGLFNMTRPPERRQILIALLPAVYVVYLVVPVFTQYFGPGREEIVGLFHLAKHEAADIVHAQLVALLGLSMLLVGFYLPFGRLAASTIPKPTKEWPAHAAVAVALLTLGIGWAVYIPGQLGLLPARGGAGVLGTLASGATFGVGLLALTWLRHRRPETLVLLAIVVPLTMFFNFFTGSKRLVLTPPFMMALAYVVYERRLRVSWLAAGFAALIALYPIANLYRAVVNPLQGGRFAEFVQDPGRVISELSRATGQAETGSYLTAGLLSTGRRLDALGVLVQIVKDTPERVPYQGGWTIGYIALSYVPRIIWADKPETTIGIWVSQSYGDPNDPWTHIGPTWLGEWYFNWGYAGVVGGMFLMGFLCRILQERLFFWGATIPALFGAVAVLYSVSRSVQGGLVGPINGTIYNLAPILVAHVMVGFFAGYYRGEKQPRRDGSAPLGSASARPAH